MLHNDFKILLVNTGVQLFSIFQHPQNDFVDRSIKTALIKAVQVIFHIKVTDINWNPKWPNYRKVSYSLHSTTIQIIPHRWQGYSCINFPGCLFRVWTIPYKIGLAIFSFVCNQLKFRLKKLRKFCFSWFHFVFSPENIWDTLGCYLLFSLQRVIRVRL